MESLIHSYKPLLGVSMEFYQFGCKIHLSGAKRIFQNNIIPYVNFSQMHIRRNFIWICIPYIMYKNLTMHINYIGIRYQTILFSYKTT
jgi:hypothetical protein